MARLDPEGRFSLSLSLSLAPGPYVFVNTTVDRIFTDFPEEAMRDMMRILCGDPLPRVIQGTYSGTLVAWFLGDALESIDGNVSFVLQNPEVYEQYPPAPGSGVYATYIGESVSLNWRVSGGTGCSVSGEASSSAVPTPRACILELEVNPARCEARRYHVSGTIASEAPTNWNFVCDGEPGVIVGTYGGSIDSPFEPDKQFRVSGGKLAGTHSNGPETWSWALDSVE